MLRDRSAAPRPEGPRVGASLRRNATRYNRCIIVDTTFTLDRLMRLVISALGVAGSVWLGRFMWQRLLGISISRNEAVLLSSAVMVFLLLTDAVRDPLRAVMYGTILVAAYFASKLATRFIK